MAKKVSKTAQNKKLKEQVEELCSRLGFWNVSPSEIAKKLSTSQQNVSRWKLQWIEKNGIPQIKRYSKELSANAQSALQELMKIAKIGDNKTKIQAIAAYFNGMKSYTEFLEAYGFKNKVADKLEIEGSVKPLDIHKLYEEIKKSGGKENE